MNVPFASSLFESGSLFLGVRDAAGSRLPPLKFGKQQAKSYMEIATRREFSSEGVGDRLLLGSVSYRVPTVPVPKEPVVEEVDSKESKPESAGEPKGEEAEIDSEIKGGRGDPAGSEAPLRAVGSAVVEDAAPAVGAESQVRRYVAQTQRTTTVGANLDVRA